MQSALAQADIGRKIIRPGRFVYAGKALHGQVLSIHVSGTDPLDARNVDVDKLDGQRT